MGRSVAAVIENNFSKGLVTEATGLNFPENACSETWDCEFDFYGRVSRRLGFNFEFGHTPSTISKTTSVINTYLWKNVTGNGLISFVVVQIGATLYFYDTSNPSSLSANRLVSTINLSTYTPSTAPSAASYDCQFADGLGKLYVFHPYLENFYVTYDSTTNLVSGTQYTLTIRDFEGVSDGLAVDARPTTSLAGMTATHKYNLYNQGWPTDNTFLTSWDTARSDMPSNCDVWWMFKNASDAFDTSTVANVSKGNGAATKGHFVLNVYNQDRNTASGLSGLTATTSGTARTSTGAFFAGRVFYSGINSAKYNSRIYYTQIIERDEQLGYCYQSADPTSEEVFDLQPSDGGVISIPEAGTIYKLIPFGSALLVFAYRGVWLITGSTGLGFSATDYTVSNISSIRTVSASSFIDVNGAPIWWNMDGIFSVQGGEGGQPQVKSLSIGSIQTFYNSIPNASKIVAKGIFNPLEQTAQWLFSRTEPGTLEEQYTYDAILNLNVLTQAFYPWTISDGASVHGVVVVDGVGGSSVENLVIDDASDQVVDDAGNIVVSYTLTNTSVAPKFKYLTSYTDSGTKFTWSEADQETYVDWATLLDTPVSYTSYLVTGFKTHGDAQRKFQSNYVWVYNEGVGAAYLQGIWDYALTPNTGRYSTKQLCIWDDETRSNNVVRKKVRGHGKTLQYFLKSLPGEPFTLVGWSTFETGNEGI